DPRHRADDQINAMRDLVDEFSDTVTLVGKKQREMRGDVTERADAEHSAHVDEIGVAEDAAERRHRKRHAKKNERPESGAVNQFVERARAVRDVVRLEHRFGKRKQQKQERRYAQRRYAAAPVAPQLPSRRRRCRHKASLPINQRRELAASHNLPNGYLLPCYHFHVGLIRRNQSKTCVLARCRLGTSNSGQYLRETEEQSKGRHSNAAPGDLHGGHRCRELWSAHCLYLRFSLLRRRLRM